MTKKTQATAAQTSAAPKKGKGWPKLGVLKRKSQNDSPYLVLDKNVEIFIDGEKLELNQYRSVKLMDPRQSLERLLAGGHITDEQFQQRSEKLDEYNIRYEMVVPPEKN